MSSIQFSVIIVSYKNLEIVIDCLKSIYKYNDIGDFLEVIVVDNSPDNNIYNYILKNFSDIKVIKNNNKGFGEGNNLGARNTRGKYLLFLNPDTVLVEPIFKFASSQFEKDKNLGVFGVKLVDSNLQRNLSYYLFDKYGIISSQIIKLCNKLDIYINRLMFTSGADMFIRRDIFFDCGMFDENIFMYYEEPDIIRRIISNNMKTAYFKSKKIIHLEGKTTDNSGLAIRRRLESAKYYNHKYNLNFLKQLKSEIRYNFIKMIIYKSLRNQNYNSIKYNINILREFRDKM